MVTIQTDRRTLILARMERDELHHIAAGKRAGFSLTRYGAWWEGGLIELALGRFAFHLNYDGGTSRA